jgi:eukaryotic-like serine/threonine-protein kinase
MATREPQRNEPEETETLLGATINGRYRIVSLIARGGMGKVYKAEQSALGRVCAIKVLSPHYEGNKDPEFHRRFSLEASTAAKLQHPNTVTIFDYGECEKHNVYYIAMEYLDGRTLHRLIHDERTITEVRASHIVQQICRSVHEAHRLGVVHRDLKPSNVLLVERGDETDFVKVLDFGLVKDVSGKGEDLTQTGLFMGSPKYMAPEQVMGGDISARTDIYSLGVILYEMIAGKVPFDRKQGMSTLIAHVNEAPQPISVRNPDALVSPEMEAIVMRCLEKEPEKRYASMKDLLNALKRAGGDLSETYESLPRARIDYEAAMKQGARSQSNPPSSKDRGAASDPSISGTLRSALVAPQTASGSGPIEAPASVELLAAPAPAANADSLSPPQASRTFTGAVERPSTSAWRPYVVALLASVIGGTTAAVVLSRRVEAPSTRTAAADSAAPAVAVAVAVSPSAAIPRGPDIRIIRIESDPPGAQVSDQGVQVCMATPCEIYWRGAASKLEHKLSLAKRGYKTTLVPVEPTDEKVEGKLEVYGASEIAALGGPQPVVAAKAEPTPSAPEAKVDPAPLPAAVAPAAVAPPAAVPAAVISQPAAPAPTPEAPAAPAAAAPMHLGDVDSRPVKVSGAQPAYTREALEAKVEGTVVAKCVVTESGAVSGCRIVKGLPFMDQAVLGALAGWKYTPAMAQGKPVAIDIPITLRLKLP